MCPSYRLPVYREVILMDLMMSGTDGVTAIRLIREQLPSTQVIALTSFQEDELVQNAMKAGAIGYLMKNVSSHEQVAAIRAARWKDDALARSSPGSGACHPANRRS